jgi:hypothetical protein
MQVFMSAGTMILGLVLAYLAADTTPELAMFGWVLAGLGLVGVILRFVLPVVTRRGADRRGADRRGADRSGTG